MNYDASENRVRLTPRDVAFLSEVLEQEGRSEALRSLLEDDEGLLAVLALDAVFKAVVESPALVGISPQFYFLVVVRHAFSKVGIDSRKVTTYVASVLATRTRGASDPTGDDAMPDYALDILDRISRARGHETYQWWRTAGDHFLVLTGIFSDHLIRRSEKRGAPGLAFYEDFGAQSYRHAGDCRQARASGTAPLLHEMADAFPDARRALNAAAEEILFLAN